MNHRFTRIASSRIALLAFAAAIGLGCGSKTGLVVPCIRDLPPVPPQVILVLDASGSIQVAPYDGGSVQNDWAQVGVAVLHTVPRFDETIDFGATLFPVGPSNDCSVASSIGVEPTPQDSDSILRFLTTAPPRGFNSPIAPGLGVALHYAQTHPTRRIRYVVLVTDGGANCNPALDCHSCQCWGGNCCISGDGSGCFDGQSIIDRVVELRREGVATAVVAIPTPSVAGPAYIAASEAVLESSATEGGFENVAGPGRSFPGDPAHLEASLTTIFDAMARTCQFALPTHLQLGDHMRIWISTNPVPFDASRREGWDWVDASRQNIQVFGPACAAYRQATGRPRVWARSNVMRCD